MATEPLELRPRALVCHPRNGLVLEFAEPLGVDAFCIALGGTAGYLEFGKVTGSSETFQSSLSLIHI